MLCWHDSEDSAPSPGSIRIVAIIELHVIGVCNIREKIQAKVERIPFSQRFRIVCVQEDSRDAIHFDHDLLHLHYMFRDGFTATWYLILYEWNNARNALKNVRIRILDSNFTRSQVNDRYEYVHGAHSTQFPPGSGSDCAANHERLG